MKTFQKLICFLQLVRGFITNKIESYLFNHIKHVLFCGKKKLN